MTLIVSLHIPDGIVMAGDSLATMVQEVQIDVEVEIDCPNCKHKHTVKHKVPYPTPSTTFSYAQKVFPFLDKYGVGTFGAGMLTGKSIYFAIREFEGTLKAKKAKPRSVEETAQMIGKYLHGLLVKEFQHQGKKVDDIPDDNHVLGIQVAGYDSSGARLFQALIGKQVKLVEPMDKFPSGCMISGQQSVTEAIWSLGEKNPLQKAQFSKFSIQDAIEYAKFLIKATASHQQFSSQMPNVGGDIDIALITPFENFRWIQQKTLSKVLSDSR